MSASLNKASILGRVGKDAEIKTMGSGDRMASFSVATSETWKEKSSGERKEKTTWHNVVIWNKFLVDTAEKSIAKGAVVYIEGQIENRSYEKDGQTKYVTEIVLPKFGGELKVIQYADKAIHGDDVYKPAESARPALSGKNPLDDEIPF